MLAVLWEKRQGRLYGFESGRGKSASVASKNFFDPHFLTSGGYNLGPVQLQVMDFLLSRLYALQVKRVIKVFVFAY
jgi:hypothetical protein